MKVSPADAEASHQGETTGVASTAEGKAITWEIAKVQGEAGREAEVIEDVVQRAGTDDTVTGRQGEEVEADQVDRNHIVIEGETEKAVQDHRVAAEAEDARIRAVIDPHIKEGMEVRRRRTDIKSKKKRIEKIQGAEV